MEAVWTLPTGRINRPGSRHRATGIGRPLFRRRHRGLRFVGDPRHQENRGPDSQEKRQDEQNPETTGAPLEKRRLMDLHLLQDDSRSLKNIAEQFDISRERIRQIEARLLKKIGRTLQQEMPDITYSLPAA